MPTAKTTHQWTAADNELEVSGKMWEPDGSLTWLRDEEARTHAFQGSGPYRDVAASSFAIPLNADAFKDSRVMELAMRSGRSGRWQPTGSG